MGIDGPERPDVGDRFAAVARSLRDQPNEPDTLDRALELAVQHVEGCDVAAFTLVRGRLVETPAATGAVAGRADELQYGFDEGPCLDVIRQHETISSADLARDPRWPRWGPAVAAELGLHGLLCFQLFTDSNSYGALNLYSRGIDAFDGRDHAIGLALAAHIAVAVAAIRQIDSLRIAVERRTVIGQAQGIVMERYGLDASQAFRFFQRVSSQTNLKLYDVADHLVRTRALPDAAAEADHDASR